MILHSKKSLNSGTALGGDVLAVGVHSGPYIPHKIAYIVRVVHRFDRLRLGQGQACILPIAQIILALLIPSKSSGISVRIALKSR